MCNAISASLRNHQEANLELNLKITGLVVDKETLTRERMETLDEMAKVISTNTVLENQLKKGYRETIDSMEKQIKSACADRDEIALELRTTKAIRGTELKGAMRTVQTQADELASADRAIGTYWKMISRTQQGTFRMVSIKTMKAAQDRRLALEAVTAFKDKEKDDQAHIRKLKRKVRQIKRKIKTHRCNHTEPASDNSEEDEVEKLGREMEELLEAGSDDSSNESAAEANQPEDEGESKEHFVKAEEVPLLEAVDADIEGQHPSLENRDVQIKILDTSLTNANVHLDRMRVEVRDLMRAVGDRDSQVTEKDHKLRTLGGQLEEEKQALQRVTAQLAETETAHLDCSSQINEKEAVIQRLGQKLESEVQASRELQARFDKQNTDWQRLTTECRDHVCDHSTCGTSSRQLEVLEQFVLSKNSKLSRLQKELNTERRQTQSLRESSDAKDLTVAGLNKSLSRASTQFGELKKSLWMSSELGIVDLGRTLNDLILSIGPHSNAAGHVCDHSLCINECERLQRHIDEVEPRLAEMTRQYEVKGASLEQKMNDYDWVVHKHNALLAQNAKSVEEKKKEKDNLLRDHAEAIRKARDEGTKISQANDPQRRTLRDLVFSNKEKFEQASRDLATRTQELALSTKELATRTEQRDHEWKWARSFKGDAERFAEERNKLHAQVQQLKANQSRHLQEIAQLRQQGHKAEESRDQLIDSTLQLGGEINALLREVAQHTTNEAPGGQKRDAGHLEDEKTGDAKGETYNPNKKAKAED